jgi:Fe2+ or Zn2+ uptake regulation protein
MVGLRRALGDENRRAVLEVLQAGAGPLGLEDVRDGLRRAGCPLGQATIRRHLGALVRVGAAERSGSGNRTVYLVRRGDEPSARGPSERQDQASQ